MAFNFLKHLKTLNECLPGNKYGISGNSAYAILISGDILRDCQQLRKESDVANAVSMLFNENDGLVIFLKKSVKYDQFEETRIKIIEFFHEFIGNYPSFISPHTIEIKDALFLVYNNDKKAKMRICVLKAIIKLIISSAGKQIGIDLNPVKIMDKFILELGSSKTSPTVFQVILELLGIIFETFPEDVNHYYERLLKIYFFRLNQQMKSKTNAPAFPVICGCFSGITSLLNVMGSELSSDDRTSTYNYIILAIGHNKDLKRYEYIRTVLNLIGKHAILFREQIYEDCLKMYQNLKEWASFSNETVKVAANFAIESYFKQIASVLCQKLELSSEFKSEAQNIFGHFTQIFCDILRSNETENIAMAVKGYGFFAAPCKLLMDKEKVNFMFSEVIHRCEDLFFSDNIFVESKISYLPSFVDALASILIQMDEVMGLFMSSLENLAIALIEHYPRITVKRKEYAWNALIKLIISLYSKGTIFKSFINKIVYQGILRTCSHSVPQDISVRTFKASHEDKDDAISFRNYIELWKIVLQLGNLKELNEVGVTIADREIITQAIYNEIMLSIITVINKLDFSVGDANVKKLSNEEDSGSDSVNEIQASKPKDFQVFVNLVEFCKIFLLENHLNWFQNWICEFGYCMIDYSTKFPLVSGFYKLFAVILKNCSKVGYFENLQLSEVNLESSSKSIKWDIKYKCFALFSKSAKEICFRLRQYKDDLLISCFQVILCLPKEIVMNILPVMVPVISKAVLFGYSYLPVIEDVLVALEVWSVQISSEVMFHLYKEIVPPLNGYLTDYSHLNNRNEKSVAAKSLLNNQMDVSTSRSLELKLRIVKFLGVLGNNFNPLLVDTRSENIAKLAVAFDTKKFMKFDLPFLDMKPTIYLDEFLPKVIELTKHSGDRQTKVVAAEVFHALILYLIGSRASLQPKLQSEKPISNLLKEIFPAVFKLACDPDLVILQLFKPLMFQLIHWFSSNRIEISNDRIILFDTMIDGITNESDVSLRDLCAQGVKELMQWTIKHTSESDLRKNPLGIKLILKRVYNLSVHPKASMRLGAAFIFNNIYAIFREEKDLVDCYVFEILYYFIESLAMCEKDGKHIGTRDHCQISINHIERIIIKSALMLKKKNSKRRIPNQLQGMENSDWENMIIWLLNQFGRQETECRHSCMTLLNKFVEISESVSDYFKLILLTKGVSFFTNIFEGSDEFTDDSLKLARFPLLVDYLPLSDHFSIAGTIAWFELLLSSLDCYTYVIGNHFLNPSDFFSSKTKPALLKGINYFNSEISMVDLFCLAKSHKLSKNEFIFTPGEIYEFYKVKCTVVVRVMDFIGIVIKTLPQFFESILEIILDSAFYKMVIDCIFHPLKIGFDMDDKIISSNLPQTIIGLLNILKQYLPSSEAIKFQSLLSKEIFDNETWNKIQQISNYKSGCNMEEQNSFRWLIAGFKMLKETNHLQPLKTFSEESQLNLANSFVNIATSMCFTERESLTFAKDLDRQEKNIAAEVLLLSFSYGLQVERLIILITDQSLVSHDSDNTKLFKGGHIFMTFKSEVNVYLSITADKSIPYLMSHMARQESLFADILISILNCLKNDSCLRKKYSDKVIDNVFLNWRELSSWWHPKSSNSLKEQILIILTQVLVLDYKSSIERDELRLTTTLDTFLGLLLDKSITLKIKIRALDILSMYTDFPIKEHLVKMMLMHFPRRCSELAQNSFLLKDYISLFKTLLMAFDRSKSLMLLEFLIELVCIELTHVCDEYIQRAIAIHITRSANEQQASTIELVYTIFMKNTDEHSDFQKSVLEKFLIPFLSKTNKVIFIKFFVTNVKDLANFILKKPLKVTDENYQHELVSKMCSYKLIELLYYRCSSDELTTVESSINSAFCSGSAKSGKELTQAITKAALGIKKENMMGETAFIELRRLVRCAAYNCLVAVVSCTQTDVKFYTGFLFTENPLKGDFLWENLVDVNRKYTFDMEFSRPVKMVKTLISMRQHEQNGENGEMLRFEPFRNDHTLKFLEDSSLKEDLSQFNFLSSKGNASEKSKKVKVDEVPSSELNKIEESENYIEMEMDDLNQHECMLQMNRLLQFLTEKITPIQPDSSEGMPSWMKAMHKSFTDDTSKGNVKLFLVRLIANNEQIFRPYAKFWLPSLLQWLIHDFSTMGLNYFISDVVVVILSWSPQTLPADNLVERGMATKLLEFLINNSFHDRRDIEKHNIEMIKILIDCWKTRIDIPTQSLYENLSNSSLSSKQKVVGIIIVGIIVSSPYNAAVGLNEDKFFCAIANNLLAKYKEVYATAAEVVGFILNFIQKREMSNEFTFSTFVQNQLSKIESNMDQFLICIYEVHKSFPDIADNFISKLVFHMPKSRGRYRLLGLKVLMSRIDLFEGLFKELVSIGFYNFLVHDDEIIQKVCLMIIQKVIRKLSIEELNIALEHITYFVSHPDMECRKVMFEILIDVFNTFCEEDSDIKNIAKNALLKGLKDDDLNIRLLILNFWSHEKRLPTSTLERLFGILGLLYLPECEGNFLETSTYLMLELTSKSLDFERFIFENPLSDCKFENYNVNTDWQVRHASMMPLFVETMSTDSFESMQIDNNETSANSSQIRATQENLLFTQTQQNEPQTWLTQSSGASFSSGTYSFDYSSKSRFPSNFGKLSKSNVVGNLEQTPTEEIDKSTISLLKRRFIKNVDAQKIFHIKRNIKLQQRRINVVHEQKSARDAKISIYRKYRKGDLPDIQILFSAIILPLQVLAQRNTVIAELLFTKLTIGILNELGGSSNREILAKLEIYLNGMLKKTTCFTPAVILAIQKIGYKFCENINIDIDSLTYASENSFTHSTGILLIERMISQHVNKSDGDNEGELYKEKHLWINLARLNKSQKNYDVVHGIVANHFGLPSEARQILEYEANGNYSSAIDLMRKFYKYVQKKTEVEDDSSEIEIWNESTLLCYHQLCQWEKLSDWSLKCFDGIDSENLIDMWSKPNYANVKSIMEGANNQSFLDFLDNSKNDLLHPDRKQYLETHCSQEMALVSIVQKDYNLAWHYNDVSLKNFINYWISISPLSFVHQFSHLEQLQSIVELGNFLSTLKLPSSDFASSARTLMESWKISLPNVSVKAGILNDIVSNRTLFMQRFKSALSGSSVIDDEKSKIFINLLGRSRFEFSVNCIEAANLQGSFSLALTNLKKIKNIQENINDASLKKKWILLYCKTHQKRLLSLNLNERVESLQNIWNNLAKYVTTDEVDLSIKIESEIISSTNANLCINLLKQTSDTVTYFEEDFFKRINCSSTANLNEICNGLVKYSYNCLKKGVQLCSLNSDRNVENIADAHLQLAKFCDKLLQDNESLKSLDVAEIGLPFENIAIELVKSLLKSIEFGSEEGIQLFCRLLQILELFPQTHEVFVKLIQNIPVWMLLRWNGQLVALLDSKCAAALHQLVVSIAETYPLALVYNFNVSKQGYTFEKSKEGRSNKKVIEKLESIFDRLTLVKDFILALEQLDHPCSRLKDLYSELMGMPNDDEVRKRVMNYYKVEIENPKKDNKGLISKIRTEFLKKAEPLFQKMFGRNLVDLKKKSQKEIKEAFSGISSNLDRLETPGTKLIKDYCVWLGEFSSNKFCTKLEIPGQYKGYSKPLPEYHVKIEKFNEQMDVLLSKAKPKAISLIGNDYKEYKYLVKSGEDLRLDQRIQQLLNIMNAIYQRDEACKSRQFKIITYQVVPLTIRLGWLEWMPNTIALKNFTEMGMNDEEKERNKSCIGMVFEFLQSFNKGNSFNGTSAIQHFYLKGDFTLATAQFKKILKQSPKNALKKSLWNLSSSPEAFITLRNRFIVSHSVLCISHYILGVGDRHLSNFLVSLKSGEIIGIDFGHSFGTGVSVLPLPELMPFRLTAQFLNLMEPLKEHGLIQRSMVHALNVLRKNSEILINCMDIFIKEPSIDWQLFAKKQSKEIGSSDDCTWYPTQKVAIAKQKLEGRNCAYIMIDELIHGVKRDEKLMSKFKEICIGAQQKSLRSTLGDYKLTTEKQVLCLIEQATDSHILSKTWYGWNPWL